MQTKILVVDDEESICEILKINLESEGYDVTVANSGEEALTLDLSVFDVMILDVMMEKISGFELAKILKENPKTANIPILFCSALNGEDEKILGLNIGADDYITKPFRIREVIARIRSILRRAAISNGTISKSDDASQEGKISYKDLVIDINSRVATVNGEDIGLTKTEFELLHFLLTNADVIHTRQILMDKVWQKSISTPRTVDTTVTRLRKKMGPMGNCIITRLGYGYGFKKNN